MTISYDDALARLAADDDHVATHAQLLHVGVGDSTIAGRCGPGGPWQRLLPRTYLLHTGQPTHLQRMRMALRYGEHGRPGSAMLTGTAVLALRRLKHAPQPEHVRNVDVLVPAGRRRRDEEFARVRPTRRMPEAVRVEGLACAPLARAVADAMATVGTDVRGLLAEVVQARRCPVSRLAEELRAARSDRLPHIAQVLADLGAGTRSPVEAEARDVVEGCSGLPRPLWNPELRLDGRFLAVPDGYWPDHGVLLEVESIAHHFALPDWESTWDRHNRLDALGLCVQHVTARQLRERPDVVLDRLRSALAGGPYGPLDRIQVLPC
jgi:hypothetical protein